MRASDKTLTIAMVYQKAKTPTKHGRFLLIEDQVVDFRGGAIVVFDARHTSYGVWAPPQANPRLSPWSLVEIVNRMY